VKKVNKPKLTISQRIEAAAKAAQPVSNPNAKPAAEISQAISTSPLFSTTPSVPSLTQSSASSSTQTVS
jgi:hypothetical protein